MTKNIGFVLAFVGMVIFGSSASEASSLINLFGCLGLFAACAAMTYSYVAGERP